MTRTQHADRPRILCTEITQSHTSHAPQAEEPERIEIQYHSGKGTAVMTAIFCRTGVPPVALRLVAVREGRADAHGALDRGDEGDLAQAPDRRVPPPVRDAHLPVLAALQERPEEPLHSPQPTVSASLL